MGSTELCPIPSLEESNLLSCVLKMRLFASVVRITTENLCFREDIFQLHVSAILNLFPELQTEVIDTFIRLPDLDIIVGENKMRGLHDHLQKLAIFSVLNLFIYLFVIILQIIQTQIWLKQFSLF